MQVWAVTLSRKTSAFGSSKDVMSICVEVHANDVEEAIKNGRLIIETIDDSKRPFIVIGCTPGNIPAPPSFENVSYTHDNNTKSKEHS